MNIRDPREFSGIKPKKPRRRSSKHLRRLMLVFFILVFVSATGLYVAYARALPKLESHNVLAAHVPEKVALAWPAKGSAAVGILQGGVLASTSNQTPTPTASVTKIMLALAVLKKKPLKLDEQGPNITVTAQDVVLRNEYSTKGGSTLAITEGEQITEYQALQAALIPSANNIADTLAVWAFGSLKEYHAFANNYAGTLGMTQSKFAVDASGFSPDTVSTPKDLIFLGQAAMQNPVIKQIVSQKAAELPIAGIVYSTNYLLGNNGIIGIKTGNTEEAGGCYLFAAERTLSNGTGITIVGAIMNAPNLYQAMGSAPALLDSTFNNFGPVTVVKKGQQVTKYDASWLGQPVYAIADKDITLYGWKGKAPDITLNHSLINPPAVKGSVAGSITATTLLGSAKSNLVLSDSVTPPTWQWRIARLWQK